MALARKWGIEVAAIPGNNKYLGYFVEKTKEIALASKEEVGFFHELAHAAHSKVKGKLKPGQDWTQEIVAELSAAVLCHLVGKTGDKHLGNYYKYIEYYAKKADCSPWRACLQVITEVEQILNLITESNPAKVGSEEMV